MAQDVGPHLTADPGQGGGLETAARRRGGALEGDGEPGGGEVVDDGPHGALQIRGHRAQSALGAVVVAVVAAQGAQNEAELVERVSGGGLDGGELLASTVGGELLAGGQLGP
jgi:hypothetical protein